MSKNNKNIFSTKCSSQRSVKIFCSNISWRRWPRQEIAEKHCAQGKDGKNLNSFIERWSNVPYSPLTEATFIEIENLCKDIQKGCLSEIPPGCGTERNEGLHRLLKRLMISGATTLSVQLAIALLTLLFYHYKQKISAEKHFCSPKIKPLAPVETNVINCNALTGNAELETESGDDLVRQPQFSWLGGKSLFSQPLFSHRP